MKFTAQEEYGLRCMLQFGRRLAQPVYLPGQKTGQKTERETRREARRNGTSEADRSFTIGEIAQVEGLTPQYAGKLIRILRIGGFLESVRGRHGGYRLARPVEQISVAEVLAALGGRVFDPAYCSRYPGDRKFCVHTIDCAIRSLWKSLQVAVDGILSRISLRNLLDTEEGASRFLGALLESEEGARKPAPDGRTAGQAGSEECAGPRRQSLVTISDIPSPFPSSVPSPSPERKEKA